MCGNFISEAIIIIEMVRCHQSVAHNSIEKTRHLLKLKADPNQLNDRGMAPLFYSRTSEMTSLLLEANADPNKQNLKGHVPLDYAPNASVASLLLEANADPNQSSIPLSRGNSEMKILLLEHRVNIPGDLRDDKTIQKWAKSRVAVLERTRNFFSNIYVDIQFSDQTIDVICDFAYNVELLSQVVNRV